MIQQIIVRGPAVEDVVDAAAWYEAHAPGLGGELIDEILRALYRARDNPELFRVVRRDGNVRRVLTNRFPYRIFFSVAGENLYVHAVLHGARHDRRWTERL
jgi:toxin ParE1/3/4